jgi:prephenate dehydrogenase
VHTQAEASAADGVTGTLAAGGFRDTSRLAASQVDMMLDILLSNRDAVEQSLTAFEKGLAEVKALLHDPNGLRTWMTEAHDTRRAMFK